MDEVVSVSRPTITVYLPIVATPDRAQLWVNGEEVSDACQRTAAYVSYKPASDLPAGNCTARFVLDQHEQSWSFVVAPRSSIRSVEIEGGERIAEFDEVGVTVAGDPGKTAWFEVDGAPGKHPLKEDAPGVYRGRFTIPGGFPKLALRVTGFVGTDSLRSTPRVLSAAGFPLSIEAPGEIVKGDVLRIPGRTRPDVEVRYSARLFFRDGIATGDLPREKWEKLRSDAQGNFMIEWTRPVKFPRLGVVLTVHAEDLEGNTAQPLNQTFFYADERPLYNPIR